MPYVSCLICSSSFYAKPRHLKIGWGKYCSKKCQYQSQLSGTPIPCLNCGKQSYKSLQSINRSKSGNFFCTKSCQTIWRNHFYAEEKHPNWKGGAASYRKRILRHNIPEFCKLCKTTDSRVLAVHHLDKNRDNNKIDNLIWLCHNCHFLIHHHQNEKNNLTNLLEVESLTKIN